MSNITLNTTPYSGMIILGKRGSGKTTFLNQITSELPDLFFNMDDRYNHYTDTVIEMAKSNNQFLLASGTILSREEKNEFKHKGFKILNSVEEAKDFYNNYLMNSLMIKVSPEDMTNIYFEFYRKYREKNDAVPYIYTAEDYIKVHHFNDDELINTALLMYESHKDNLSSIMSCDRLLINKERNRRNYDEAIYHFDNISESNPYAPHSFFIDMRASYNVELLKEKELDFFNKLIEVIPSRKDRKDLLKLKKSGYFASTIARIEQKEIEQVMNEKPVVIKKKVRL
ncbi:hypothetical protein JN201_004302 [Salmonella enterica subsp. enterica serovar Infantis]|nr:hypothetical protein [Salmonella enterica subsp. enterica serovar Infantis]EKK4438494.1 hypothetical protein [Salmonella enterica]EKY4234033.1 hypothetical protein [Salmonella enterica]ELJ3372317.1 hypothetical protein [Salmonella enterica subsp. enterica serovar Infantis]